MNLVLTAFLFTIVPGIFYSILSGKRVELFLLPALLTNALALFIFGCLGYLYVGMWCLCILQVLMFGYSLITVGYSLYHKNYVFLKRLRETILVPGLLFFITGTIAVYVITYGKTFIRNDDFSHWGRIVKVMFEYDVLPAYSQEVLSLIRFQSYPPGTALLQYLFSKLYNPSYFVEYAAIFTMQIITVSCFSLVFMHAKWKEIIIHFLFFVTLWLSTIVLYPGMFDEMQVDLLLGILMASAAYLIVASTKPSWIEFTVYTVICSFLVLVKQSGAGLVVMLTIPLAATGSYKAVIALLKRDKCRLKIAALYFLPLTAFVFHIIWKAMSAGVKQSFSGRNITLANFFHGLSQGDQGHIQTVCKNFIDAVFINPEMQLVSCKVSFFSFIVIVSLLLFIIAQIMPSLYRHKLTVVALANIPFFCIYSITLLLYYCFSFSVQEAINLASLHRYLGTFILADCVLLFATGVLGICVFKSKLKYLLLLLLLLVVVNREGTYVGFAKNCASNNMNKIMEEYEIAKAVVNPYLEKDTRFFSVLQEDTFYSSLYFSYMWPGNSTIAESFGPPQYEGDCYSKNKTEKEFEEIIGNNQYCYIFNVNEDFQRRYGKFFSGEKIKNKQLYKVEDKRLEKIPLKTFVFNFKNLTFLKTEEVQRAVVRYALSKQAHIVALSDFGSATLASNEQLPLENGFIKTIKLSINNVKGEAAYQLFADNIAVGNGNFKQTGIHEIEHDILLKQSIKQLKLKFTGKSDKSVLQIKRIEVIYNE